MPQNLTEYALNRIRYSIAIAFRELKVVKSEMGVYLINHKTEEAHHYKVKLINNYLFCTCMQYFHTGTPCEHVLLCALTHGKKFLIH